MKGISRLSIHDRVLLVALLPAALIATLVTTLVLYRGTQALDDALNARGYAIASFLAPAAEYGVISGNRSSLEPLVRAVRAQADVSGVAIYADEGELLASGGRFQVVERNVLNDADGVRVIPTSREVLAVLAPVYPSSVAIDDAFGHGFGAEPAPPRETRPAGWVYVELDARRAAREKNLIIAATCLLLLAGLGSATILAVRLARSVSQPVGRLVTGVTRMAAGGFDVQLPERATNAELAALERGFNKMALAISDMHRTMQSRIDEATARLAHLAHHDALTGLPNRRSFEQQLEELVAASRRADDHGALCFIDLDRFKIVNDSCGHAAGDELLRHIARLLRQRVREKDAVCRVGGDEFAVILRACTRHDALRIAEGLREALAAFRFECDGRRFSVGASIGLIHIDGALVSPSEVLMAADLACYAAKKSGRNRVIEHSPESGGRPDMSSDGFLRGPEEDEGFALHVQPIVALAGTDAGRWLEVLLRVSDAQGREQPTEPYLARLEETGKALELDISVATRACAAAVHLESDDETGAPVALSLNLTRMSVLEGAQFVERLHAIASEHRLAPEKIVLELPATIVEQLPVEARRLIERARAAGFRIALQQLDGAGIRHLSALRPDCVKISLYRLIAAFGMEAGCNLAQALAGMASALGIATIATEVEDPVLLDSLHAYGFDFAQGRALSPPSPLALEQRTSPEVAEPAAGLS